MAEDSGNSFDFTVSVPVDLDFSKARDTAKREFAALQGMPVSLPVGGGALPGGVASPNLPTIIGGGGAPPSTAIATAAQNAVNQALAPTAATQRAFYGSSGMTGVGGSFAAAQMLNIPNAPAVGGGLGPPTVLGADGGGGGGSFPVALSPMLGAGRTLGGGRAGYGGMMGIGFALYAAGRMAMASVEHDHAVRQAAGDPAGIVRADIAYQDRAARAFSVPGEVGLFLREKVTGDQEYIENTMRSAERQDRLVDSQRERMFTNRRLAAGRGFSAAVEETRIAYDEKMGDLRLRQGRLNTEMRQMKPYNLFGFIHIPGWDSSALSAEDWQGKRAESVELGRQMETAGRQQKHDQAQLLADQAIERAGIRASAAGYADIAGRRMSPIQMDRRALVRAQEIEWARARESDASLLPDLAQKHMAQRAAFDVQSSRGEWMQNIQTEWIVRSAASSEKNQPFAAHRQAAYGAYRAQWEGAEGNDPERRRLTAEYRARDKAYVTGFARDVAQGLNQSADQQLVTQKLLDRDNLGAHLAGIAAQRNAALTAADALPPGIRERVQSSINRGADLQARLSRRQEADTLRGVGMNVETRRQVSEIIADNSRPWGERVAAAQAEGIADDALQRAEVWRQRGVGYEKFRTQELEIGRNELRAAKQAFVRSLQPVEIESLSRVALTGTDIDKNLREFRAQEDRLKKGGDRTGAFGPAPADSQQGVPADMSRNVSELNATIKQLIIVLENGIPALAGP